MGRGLANGLYNRLAQLDDRAQGGRPDQRLSRRAGGQVQEFLYLLPNGFSYPTTSTMAFFRAGYSVAYIPIHAAKRIGKSHIRLLRDGTRFCSSSSRLARCFHR